MRKIIALSPQKPQDIATIIEFVPAWISVFNPTGTPIYVRFGGLDYPSVSNASEVVPAQTLLTIPTKEQNFAFTFANLLLPTATVGSLSNIALITIADSSEREPSATSLNFAASSLSYIGSYVGVTALNSLASPLIVTMGSWGGLIINVYVGKAGTIFVTDPVTLANIAVVGVTDNSVVTIAIPRVSDTVQISIADPTVPAVIDPCIVNLYIRGSTIDITNVGVRLAARQPLTTLTLADGTSQYIAIPTQSMKGWTTYLILTSGDNVLVGIEGDLIGTLDVTNSHLRWSQAVSLIDSYVGLTNTSGGPVTVEYGLYPDYDEAPASVIGFNDHWENLPSLIGQIKQGNTLLVNTAAILNLQSVQFDTQIIALQAMLASLTAIQASVGAGGGLITGIFNATAAASIWTRLNSGVLLNGKTIRSILFSTTGANSTIFIGLGTGLGVTTSILAGYGLNNNIVFPAPGYLVPPATPELWGNTGVAGNIVGTVIYQ